MGFETIEIDRSYELQCKVYSDDSHRYSGGYVTWPSILNDFFLIMSNKDAYVYYTRHHSF